MFHGERFMPCNVFSDFVGKIFEFKISGSCVLYSVAMLWLGIDFVISLLPHVNTGKVFCYVQLTWAALIAASAVPHHM